MRRFGRLLAIALLLLPMTTPRAAAQAPAPETDRIATLHREAVTLYRDGRFDQAAIRYEQLIKLQPENKDLFRDLMWLQWRAEKPEQAAKVAAQVTSRWPKELEAWNLLGSALTALDRKGDAAAAFEKSLELDAKQPRVQRVLAQLQLDLKQYAKAERLAAQALKRDPEAREFYPVLARAQTFQEKHREAAQSWAKARAAFPDQLGYHYQEAAALVQNGQTDAALKSLDEMAKRHEKTMADPEQLRIWRIVAQMYLDLQQYDRAEQLAARVLAHQPNALELYLVSARAQTFQKKHREAAQSWAKARAAFPDQLSYHYQEVEALSQSGQADAALKSLDEMVSRHRNAAADPEQLRIWRLAAQMYLELGRHDQAERVIAQVLERHPSAKEFYPLQARARTLQKRFPEAAQSWAKARAAFPDQLSYHYQEVEALSQSGQTEPALRSLDEMVSRHRKAIDDPEQQRVWRLAAQMYLQFQRYDEAERLASQVLKRNPGAKELYPVLAWAQSYQGRFSESAKTWAKAREAFPDQPSYQYQEAMALSQSGKLDDAQRRLQALVTDHPDFDLAVNQLVDQAMVRQDWAQASQLLEEQLANATPADSLRFLKLAQIYREMGDTDRQLDALDRCLELNPSQGEALMMKAEQLEVTGRLGESARAYRQILRANPQSLPALDALAGVEFAQGRHREAVQAIEQARQIDPRDPYLLLSHARYLHAQGGRQEAKQMLTQWLRTNERTVVPVLLYHALVTAQDDPLLASPVHMTTDRFEDHIRSLKEADYTAVTAAEVLAWYQGGGALPARPVLITFDDARMDSLRQADPVLQKYGFKATMFVPITNVERGLPGYATWDHLKRFQRSGRWEIQSHGWQAARYVQIDPEGRRGLFLAHRQWLADQNRMESEEEWRARISNDYAESQRMIAQQIGTSPVAFAYPNSQFGQVGFPNAPDAALTNLRLAGQVYGSTYHQETYGINVRSDDPAFLERVEPKPGWSGADLVRHFEERSPFIMMLTHLTRQAIWDGRLREAAQWLGELEREGAPPALVMVEQARMHYAAGDPAQGRVLLDRTLQFDRSQEIDAMATSLREADARWNWTPNVSAMHDSNDRQALTLDQQLGGFTTGRWAWTVNQRSGFYSQDRPEEEEGVVVPGAAEEDSDDVMGHGAGLGVSRNLGLFHQWQASGMGMFYSGGEAEGVKPVAETSLRSRWTDNFSTRIGASYEPIETAQALSADVQEGAATVQAAWKGDQPWDALAIGRGAALSDNNSRMTASIEVGRRLVEWLPKARISYRFTFDDTAEISENYYSPQQLMLHQVGLGYELISSRHVDLAFQYLPGFGTEQTGDGDVVAGSSEDSASSFSQSLEVTASLKWKGRPWLQPSIFISDTPTYNSQRVGLRFHFRF